VRYESDEGLDFVDDNHPTRDGIINITNMKDKSFPFVIISLTVNDADLLSTWKFGAGGPPSRCDAERKDDYLDCNLVGR
jgi:hypothetical protein